MSEPTSDEFLRQMGILLNQGRVEEATALANPMKKRILQHLREGNEAEARRLMAPIMLLPPDRAFLTEYATLTAALMSEEKPKKRRRFWKRSS